MGVMLINIQYYLINLLAKFRMKSNQIKSPNKTKVNKKIVVFFHTYINQRLRLI